MDVLSSEFGAILEAFWVTVKLTFYAGIGSLIVGTLLTAMRVSPVPVLRGFASVYVNTVRNIPLTLVIFFMLFGLGYNLGLEYSSADLNVNNFWHAVVGFIAYTSCFVSEALRSGINTVPVGQAEAARAIGLTFTQNLRIVVLPQAFRSVIAPLGSVFIALTKNTTIATTIGVAEPATKMKELIEVNSDIVLLIFAIFAAGFMFLTLPMGLFTSWLAKRMAVAR